MFHKHYMTSLPNYQIVILFKIILILIETLNVKKNVYTSAFLKYAIFVGYFLFYFHKSHLHNFSLPSFRKY